MPHSSIQARLCGYVCVSLAKATDHSVSVLSSEVLDACHSSVGSSHEHFPVRRLWKNRVGIGGCASGSSISRH